MLELSMSDAPQDDLSVRRARRQQDGIRRAMNGVRLPSSRNDLPGWITRFAIPSGACAPCSRHWHHRCHGVDVLQDPIPDCPCNCGDRKDPMRLSPEAWADLSLHAPDQVWIAAMFERQRAAGIHACAMDDVERHRAIRWEERR